ncbi:MAG TPA: hypothetical protein VNI57_07035, partial [Candidatus Saccharimonadales bacterium]|nr:hypothetical protein [Candidatus Saccharimonadales bacterium]
MKPSVVIRIAAALACTVPGIQSGAGATNHQTVTVIPAPPLTPAQIDRLKHVTSWDLEYTGLVTISSSATGLVPETSPHFPWSHVERNDMAYHVKARIAGRQGQSACNLGSTNPCVVQYGPEGKVEVSIDHRLLDDTETLLTGCSPSDPNVFENEARIDLEGPGGSYVPDGTSGKSSAGHVDIDYGFNPPLVYSSLQFSGLPAVQIRQTQTCAISTAVTDTLSRGLDAAWDPPSFGCCQDGDSQVRLEHGAFVVHGISNEIVTGSACEAFVFNLSSLCADPNHGYDAPYTENYHYEWVLREHDCQDTNGNGNSDDDDDGLCDNWETNGLDVDGDGVVDL